MALEFMDNNFENEVINSDKLVLVDFWADWCGPCKMLTPTLEQLSNEYSDKIVVGKVNVDDNQQLASQYGIMSIPTVMIFKGGKIVEQFIGVQPKGVYEGSIKKYLGL